MELINENDFIFESIDPKTKRPIKFEFTDTAMIWYTKGRKKCNWNDIYFYRYEYDNPIDIYMALGRTWRFPDLFEFWVEKVYDSNYPKDRFKAAKRVITLYKNVRKRIAA